MYSVLVMTHKFSKYFRSYHMETDIKKILKTLCHGDYGIQHALIDKIWKKAWSNRNIDNFLTLWKKNHLYELEMKSGTPCTYSTPARSVVHLTQKNPLSYSYLDISHVYDQSPINIISILTKFICYSGRLFNYHDYIQKQYHQTTSDLKYQNALWKLSNFLREV